MQLKCMVVQILVLNLSEAEVGYSVPVVDQSGGLLSALVLVWMV